MENKFNQGKIYKVYSPSSDKVYIGSTCLPLYIRFSYFKANYKAYLIHGKRYTTAYELIMLGDSKIELVEDYSCSSGEQLHKRERYHIETIGRHKCVNKNIPSRKFKEYKILYDILNKDKIQEKLKTKYHKEKQCTCGEMINEGCFKAHVKSQKHLKKVQFLEEMDILVSIVKEEISKHKTYKNRVEEVRKALQQVLTV